MMVAKPACVHNLPPPRWLGERDWLQRSLLIHLAVSFLPEPPSDQPNQGIKTLAE
jgi:hypothetical protein